MRIETEIKLDYKDVLLRPKRSVLGSRKEVDLNRRFNFRNCSQVWEGIPIVAANMDHVGTVRWLMSYQNLICLHVFTNILQLKILNVPYHLYHQLIQRYQLVFMMMIYID